MPPWVDSPVILIHSHVDLLTGDGIVVEDLVLEVSEEEVDGVEVVEDLVEQEEEPPVQNQEDVDIS